MAGKTPFFVTGSNCKIKVNGVTLAYATDLTYNAVVNHIPAKVLGLYEADSLEPLSYSINGTFTVVRYIDGMTDAVKKAKGKPVNGSSIDGNGIGSFTINRGNSLTSIAGRSTGNLTNDGRTNEALNPSALSRSMSFDIEVYQKVPKGKGTTTNRTLDVIEGRNANINPFVSEGEGSNYLGVSRIRDCKITGVNATISKKGLMIQTFSFIGNYLDEDSFISSSSGVGQQYS